MSWSMDHNAIAMPQDNNSPIQSGRSFTCEWNNCGKVFNRKSDLARHFRIHTNDRPYACTWEGCDKAFIQRSALTVHVRTHTGEKPHQCDAAGCRKCFSDSSSLARHRRIHTGRRPYTCPQCERSFCRKTTLTKHLRRTHRHEAGVSPDPSSEASDSESIESPSSPPQICAMPISGRDVPGTNWPVLQHPATAALHPGMPQRSMSMNYVGKFAENDQTGSPNVQQVHRYSVSEHNRSPHPGPGSQYTSGYSTPHPESTRHQTRNNMIPLPTETSGAIPVSNPALAAAHLQSNPSIFSSQTSPQKQGHDVFATQAATAHNMNYHLVNSNTEPQNTHFGQYQDHQVQQTPQVAYTPQMVTQQMVPQGQQYQDSMPYQEPVAVVQMPQPYQTPVFPFGVAEMDGLYKPEDLILMAPTQEFMTPSMRAAHEMANGF